MSVFTTECQSLQSDGDTNSPDAADLLLSMHEPTDATRRTNLSVLLSEVSVVSFMLYLFELVNSSRRAGALPPVSASSPVCRLST